MDIMAYTSKSGFSVKDNLTPGLKKYFDKVSMGQNKSGSADQLARTRMGLQLLNIVVNGSANESVVPPIMTGVLRGSGSVFTGSVFVGDTKANYPNGTPNASYSEGDPNDITVGLNTAYAARLHETQWTAGGKRPSAQSLRNPGMLGNVGNKFIEKHLKADGKDLVKFYAGQLKKESGA
jgi:hypothetical protein